MCKSHNFTSFRPTNLSHMLANLRYIDSHRWQTLSVVICD